jgi:hypothetical protein
MGKLPESLPEILPEIFTGKCARSLRQFARFFGGKFARFYGAEVALKLSQRLGTFSKFNGRPRHL